MSFFPSSSGFIINGGTFMNISLPTQDAAAPTQVLRKRKDHDSWESDDYAQADDLRVRKRRRGRSLETLDGLTIIKRDEFDLNKELISGTGYHIHSASHHGGLVLVKAFEGPRAKQDWNVDVTFSKEFLHSNVLKIIGVSDEKSKSNFILYRGITSEQKMQSVIATALRTDLNMSVQVSMKAVKGIAAGLSYIESQNIPMYPGTMNNNQKWGNFNIFTGYDNEPIISFDPSGTVHENVLQNFDDEMDGSGVEVLSEICQQLFSEANSILYDDSPEREFVVYDREGFQRAPLEDEEGPSNVSEKDDVSVIVSNHSNSTEKTESCRTPSPRREVRWLDLGARNRSLESIKRCFQDRLDRFLSSSKSLLRRITSPVESKLRHNLHQCPGYLREEITLASDVSKSAIVSHSFPSQSEVCSICGQLVQYNRTEPSIVDDEKLEVPRYPSQNNFQNMASLSSLSSPMEDASNIRETYGYSASHSGSLTLDSVSCQWEDCIEVFTHLETLTHHIHNDHIGVNNSSYACGWTTCVRRGLPQTSRFALISHLRSHIGEKGPPTSRNPMMTLPLSMTMRDQVHPLVLEHLESFYILDFPIDQLTEHLVEMAIQSNPHRIALCNPLSSQVFLKNYDHILEMTLNILRRVFSLKKITLCVDILNDALFGALRNQSHLREVEILLPSSTSQEGLAHIREVLNRGYTLTDQIPQAKFFTIPLDIIRSFPATASYLTLDP